MSKNQNFVARLSLIAVFSLIAAPLAQAQEGGAPAESGAVVDTEPTVDEPVAEPAPGGDVAQAGGGQAKPSDQPSDKPADAPAGGEGPVVDIDPNDELFAEPVEEPSQQLKPKAPGPVVESGEPDGPLAVPADDGKSKKSEAKKAGPSPIVLKNPGIALAGTNNGGNAGVAGGLTGHIQTRNQVEDMYVELYAGKPILRVNIDGVSHRLDLDIVKPFSYTEGDTDQTFELKFVPLAASGSVTVPTKGENFRGRIHVSPHVAAKYGLAVGGAFEGEVHLNIGAAGGVAGDGDGSAPILGAEVKAGLSARYLFNNGKSAVGGAYEFTVIGQVLGDLATPTRHRLDLNYTHITRAPATEDGKPGEIKSTVSFGPYVNASDFDVVRGANTDTGGATEAGALVTIGL